MRPASEPQVEVSFNAFIIYQVASSDLGDGWRHLNIFVSQDFKVVGAD